MYTPRDYEMMIRSGEHRRRMDAEHREALRRVYHTPWVWPAVSLRQFTRRMVRQLAVALLLHQPRQQRRAMRRRHGW